MKSYNYIIALIFTLILASCINKNESKESQVIVIPSDEISALKKADIQPIRIYSKELEEQIDSFLENKFDNVLILEQKSVNPVKQSKTDKKDSKVYIDSTIVMSKVKFLKKKDTLEWMIMFEEGQIVYDYEIKENR